MKDLPCLGGPLDGRMLDPDKYHGPRVRVPVVTDETYAVSGRLKFGQVVYERSGDVWLFIGDGKDGVEHSPPNGANLPGDKELGDGREARPRSVEQSDTEDALEFVDCRCQITPSNEVEKPHMPPLPERVERPNAEILIDLSLVRMLLDLPAEYNFVDPSGADLLRIPLFVDHLPRVETDCPLHLITPVYQRVETGKSTLQEIRITPSEDR